MLLSYLRPLSQTLVTPGLFFPLMRTKHWIDANQNQSEIIPPNQTASEKIRSIATDIFKACLCGALLHWRPNTFWIGFVIGIIFPDQVEDVTFRIYSVWIKWKMPQKICFPLMSAWFQWPMTVYASVFAISAYLGTNASPFKRRAPPPI